MSDTTKIDKVRVNGVLYDLAGSGSGGGISGLYTAPLDLIEADYKGFKRATIDPMALIEQLEKAGIDVDQPPLMDSNEYEVSYNIGNIRVADLNNSNTNMNTNMRGGSTRSVSQTSIINIYISRTPYNAYGVTINMLYNSYPSLINVDATRTSLRQIIFNYFSQYPNNYVDLPRYDSNQLGYIVNSLDVYYALVHTTLKYYISDLTEFCDDVLIEYNSGSDSGSGYEAVPPAFAV